MKKIHNTQTFNVFFSEEDEGFIVTMSRCPGISAFGETIPKALKEMSVVFELLEETDYTENRTKNIRDFATHPAIAALMTARLNAKRGRQQYGVNTSLPTQNTYLGSGGDAISSKAIEAREILYNLYLQGFEVTKL